MMSYLGGNVPYGEWRIREKERKAKARREYIRNFPKYIVVAILEIVGFIKDSAIFYNHQWRKSYVRYTRTTSDVQKLIRNLSQVLAALVFFAVLVVGLNALAVLL